MLTTANLLVCSKQYTIFEQTHMIEVLEAQKQKY